MTLFTREKGLEKKCSLQYSTAKGLAYISLQRETVTARRKYSPFTILFVLQE